MSNIFTQLEYNKMIVRAASVKRAEDYDLFETTLAEINIGERKLYFAQDPVNQLYLGQCIHYSKEMSDELDKAEARPLRITEKLPIKKFIDAIHNSEDRELSDVVLNLVKQVEAAGKKGRAY